MIVHINDKHFGSKVIFSNLTLELPDGSVNVIKGISGRGKTTLLRLILGLDKDYSGFIESPAKFPVALFQEDRLVERLTVGANLRAVSKDSAKISTLLKALDLEKELNSKVDTLSGGMKRRVAIIRALLLDYDWLILDEPFKGLDSELKKRVAALVKSMTVGKGVILVTHEDEEANLFSGNIIEL